MKRYSEACVAFLALLVVLCSWKNALAETTNDPKTGFIKKAEVAFGVDVLDHTDHNRTTWDAGLALYLFTWNSWKYAVVVDYEYTTSELSTEKVDRNAWGADIFKLAYLGWEDRLEPFVTLGFQLARNTITTLGQTPTSAKVRENSFTWGIGASIPLRIQGASIEFHFRQTFEEFQGRRSDQLKLNLKLDLMSF